MRVAVYGGSFNPPHVGHAMVASWLRWTDQADEVWLVPTLEHAFGKHLAPFSKRLAWCEALASLVPGCRVEPIERELPVPSYTVDTLGVLARRSPEHTFRLVVGADNIADLDAWKSWDLIERDYSPIIVGRQGYPKPEDTVDFPGVSSTEVRRRMALGQSLTHLVPAEVLRLIGPGDLPYDSDQGS